ncbi:MAG: cobyrinate a,c-diamide synthase [Thermodesulfobacteriota bacterium]|nr:cobyrinate a,c-diamide synthase [Thermodesulfobacteriota bacterium]
MNLVETGENRTKPQGLIVAGMGGGSGKSVVSVGLTAHFAASHRKVYPFKKGPDYIDAGWLQLAAGVPCYNLDPYLMEKEDLLLSFYSRAAGAAICLIEGNRGLYDGVDVDGSFSTAELALQLDLPVLLVVDCTKTTRTVAALVLGCLKLDPAVCIRGVVLNRIGGARHESIVRQSVEKYTGVPVLGAIPRMKRDIFPMRHLGVTPFQEYEGADEAITTLTGIARQHLDLAAVEQIMEPVEIPEKFRLEEPVASSLDRVRIGVLRDAAFQFYYPENFKALERAGADLVEINSLTAPELPDIHGLYIGGGFPETSIRYLSANISFRKSIKDMAKKGLPIYAECGGLIFLGRKIILDGESFPLVDLFPVEFSLQKKPQAHGYTVLEAGPGNPFYKQGTQIKGHEFRYSRVDEWPGSPEDLTMDMKRGVGFVDKRDGLVYKNVLALYTHIHAVGTPEWAPALITRAREFKKKG